MVKDTKIQKSVSGGRFCPLRWSLALSTEWVDFIESYCSVFSTSSYGFRFAEFRSEEICKPEHIEKFWEREHGEKGDILLFWRRFWLSERLLW